jgi:hypothetical protein
MFLVPKFCLSWKGQYILSSDPALHFKMLVQGVPLIVCLAISVETPIHMLRIGVVRDLPQVGIKLPNPIRTCRGVGRDEVDPLRMHPVPLAPPANQGLANATPSLAIYFTPWQAQTRNVKHGAVSPVADIFQFRMGLTIRRLSCPAMRAHRTMSLVH